MHAFTSVLRRSGNVGSTTFLPIPQPVMDALAPRKRVPVRVTINGHTWRSTISIYDDRAMVAVNAGVRAAAGVAEGQRVDALLEVDDAPRVAALPDDLTAALEAAGLMEAFRAFAPSHQKEFLVWVEAAKRAETREKRIAGTVERTRAKTPLDR
jgi:hypothetical protein